MSQARKLRREVARLERKGKLSSLWGEWKSFEPAQHDGQEPMLNHIYQGWQNALFVVFFGRVESEWGDVIHVMIRRKDEQPIGDWDTLQRVKNDLCGAEATAIEVYPSQEQLVNEANMRHLWVLPNKLKLPFGLHLFLVEKERIMKEHSLHVAERLGMPHSRVLQLCEADVFANARRVSTVTSSYWMIPEPDVEEFTQG